MTSTVMFFFFQLQTNKVEDCISLTFFKDQTEISLMWRQSFVCLSFLFFPFLSGMLQLLLYSQTMGKGRWKGKKIKIFLLLKIKVFDWKYVDGVLFIFIINICWKENLNCWGKMTESLKKYWFPFQFTLTLFIF